jgi:hypothetical protein
MVSRPVYLGVKSHMGPKTTFLLTIKTAAGFLMWSALSDERMGLSFTTAAGPRQRSHSRFRYFTVSDSRLPQPGGPGPRIDILQEQGGQSANQFVLESSPLRVTT